MAQTEKGIVYPDDYSKVADVPADMQAMAESIDDIIGTMEEDVNEELENRVEKEEGKGLSSNDFDDIYKENVDDNTEARHAHSNKSILDLMTAYYTAEEKEKLEDLENYDDTALKGRVSTAEGKIEDIEAEQTTQNTAITNNENNIEDLQVENARLKQTLVTTTGTGENITLNKTAELDFVIPPLPEGNTKQNTTEGKNLFNKNSSPLLLGSTVEPLSTGIRVSQSDPGTWRGVIYPLIDVSDYVGKVVRANTKVSVNGSNQPYVGLVLCDSAGGNRTSLYSTTSTGNVSIQATIPTLGASTYLGLSVDSNSNGTGVAGSYCDYQDLIITIDNSDMTYEEYTGRQVSPNPSYEQEVQVVKGDVEVLIQNKNLFNTEWEQGYINTNGENENSSDFIRTKDYIYFEPEQKYAIQRSIATAYTNVRGYDKNKRFVGTGSNVIVSYSGGADNPMQASVTTCVIATKPGVYYLRFNDASNNLLTEYMMVKGDQSSDYTPHKEQILPLTLGDIELCKIGDCKDYFYKNSGKWYWHKETGKLVLDGSENEWSKSTTTEVDRFVYNTDLYVNNANSKCNYFIKSGITTTIGRWYNNANVQVGFSFTEYGTTTLEQWKEWVSTHNLILVQPLVTPIDIEITDTTLINQLEAINNAISYYEQTNISGTSSGISPLFDVEAYQSTKLLLENALDRLELLES